MAQTRCGISAKQLKRELGVTYKTAWRMFKLIRSRLTEDNDPFSGDVEADETYIGGPTRGDKRGRGAEKKVPVFGLVQRQGKVRAVEVFNVKSKTLMPIITANVVEGSTVHMDEFMVYDALTDRAYDHKRVFTLQRCT